MPGQTEKRKLTHEEIQASKPSVEAVKKMARMPLIVVLDNLRSLYNVGAIFRTADAISAEKLYLCGITGKPPRKEIAKAALGATEVVPWEYGASTRETLLKLKGKGVKICALELCRESVDYAEFDYQFPMALVVGNEISGISENVMDLVDDAVMIPMLGRANSLNVATSFGIAGYEILKKWRTHK
ncbi:RNA methyltransferase [Candidatus Gracilibacteria bacterium]|nr:RNA methyltransferase [Candidatus Gracilibacteria bacterium]